MLILPLTRLSKFHFKLPNRRCAKGLLLLVFSLLLVSFSQVSTPGYALSLPALSPAGLNPVVQVPLQNPNTTTTNSGIAPEQSQPQPPPTFANRSAWQGYMSHNPAPQPGCFVATYANPVWQSAQCVTAPSEPFMPSHAQAMLSTWSGGGSGSDWVAQAPGDVISTSTGSFQSVTTTGETCTCSGGANDYSLQINSNAFPTNTIYTQPPGGSSFGATGWEQFIYSTQKGILIQYWVLGYYTEYSTCPGIGPPNGISWKQSGGDCYADSPAQPVPAVPVTSLSSLTLTGNAFNPNLAVSKNDQVTLCGVSNPSGGSCYAVAITAKVLDLYENWQDSEFNVFGDASDSLAIFNSPTTITVVQTLLDQNLKGIVPSCVNKEPETNGFNGFTGESNNLNLGSCAVSGNFAHSFYVFNRAENRLCKNHDRLLICA